MSTDPTGVRAAPASGGSASDLSVAEPAAQPSMKGRREQARSSESPGPTRPEGPSRSGSRKAPPRRKRKVRKVHRVVRHIEVWSVAKLATVFAACGYFVAMISGYLLWQAADRVGTIEGIEGFMEDSGSYDSFELIGGVVFRVAAVTGVVIACVAVALVVLGVLLFNLISDLTGGIRMTVIDEDLIVAPARRPEAGAARRPPTDAARRPPSPSEG